ncbi:related to DNA repair family protein [Ramularia collo-cygni]|uniref:Related to DNA repair family protein n=1 Tax=Ramularia collo-cygni TaxID=112498 RepID=A0A2D3VI19_9PEZI|nr:related to DNA repair family protein [Ramularia collo-cygni]CZT22839.1 related to DNA repair family protein [Ramularia collo-cygni]
MSKRPRTLDSFFAPHAVKKSKLVSEELSETAIIQQNSRHATYPFAIPELPLELREMLNFVPATEGRVMNNQPDLDLLYFSPYIPKDAVRGLFEFLRHELFFYRVKYNIKRGPVETQINTPRYTTVFGVDDTARFDDDGALVDAKTEKPVAQSAYKQRPRPIPACLDDIRKLTEAATGCTFNFALVNYYATGEDSISYHSDNEKFLGIDPAIASFSLGAKRDFLLKHKPTPQKHESETKPTKLNLQSGDMILMRGKTQSNWLHSIPKRKGGEADKGRINITFRKAMIRGGTDNYYRYNVGDGGIYKWSDDHREMLPSTNVTPNA